MILSDIEKLVSRAQNLSIVDAMDRKLALWFGSVSAGKQKVRRANPDWEDEQI